MKLFLPVLLSLLCISAQATDSRSDSIDILNYSIRLDMTDFAGKQISGSAVIHLKAKVNGVSELRFDLLHMQVNAVQATTQTVTYGYSDPLVQVMLSDPLQAGDTLSVVIHYSGQPASSSFGGFYFSGVYAFNLGVDMFADPHCYGRVWFPCFDNFTERSTYDFAITCDTANKAIANGLLQSVSAPQGAAHTWYWKLDEPIPTYLASVAVAPYALLQSTFHGQLGDKPVILACLPADTIDMKAAFINLDTGLHIFEKYYGPYHFSRVGFNAVPFNGGAMEHATSITYPRFALAGGTTYETLWAHELSHHWWGDLVTCRTAEDMWINEGWASYSEKLFLEMLYGRTRYRQAVRDNHRFTLQMAHIIDGQPLAVSGISTQYTYGPHVYKKGADVAHTLRGYMGDQAFMNAIAALMVQKKFQDISSADLQQVFENSSGMDLDAFFQDWVYSPGFPHFTVKAINYTGASGNYNTGVRLQQQSRFNTRLYKQVPLTVRVYGREFQYQDFNTVQNIFDTTWNFTTSFEPVLVVLDPEEKISDAVTDQMAVVRQNGLYVFMDAYMNVNVTNVQDSALLRVEHHWVSADESAMHIPGLAVSDYRYWAVDGIWSNLSATATIPYNGSTVQGAFYDEYIDQTLIKQTEDSLVLVYRTGPEADWQIWPTYTKNMGNKLDKRGTITINGLTKGQYALAMYDKSLSTGKPLKKQGYNLRVYPNPTGDQAELVLQSPVNEAVLKVYDQQGKCVMEQAWPAGAQSFTLLTQKWSSGVYWINLDGSSSVKLVVAH